jgi:hypothetical protein
MGGRGSSRVNSKYAVLPLDAIKEAAGTQIQVTSAHGRDTAEVAALARKSDVALVFVGYSPLVVIADAPVTMTKYGNYPGKDLVVTYSEGIYVGYRGFDKSKIEPLFPFGRRDVFLRSGKEGLGRRTRSLRGLGRIFIRLKGSFELTQ